jgi:hypothetical protein
MSIGVVQSKTILSNTSSFMNLSHTKFVAIFNRNRELNLSMRLVGI